LEWRDSAMVKISKEFPTYSKIFYAAAVYNILWGSLVVFFPKASIAFFGLNPLNYYEIWQCVGMIVAVYGLAYAFAASDPRRYWPIILVGLVGKVLGPIGFLEALYRQVFPLSFAWNIVFNDLIWWLPFGAFLLLIYKERSVSSLQLTTKANWSAWPHRKKVAFINSVSGFRNAFLLSTKSEDGVSNLSLVTNVFHVGAEPALIACLIRPDTVTRDSLNNIRKNKVCTLNHVCEDILEQAHQCSARFDAGVSEFLEVGLNEEESALGVPYVKESKIKLALKLVEEKSLVNKTHLLVFSIEEISMPSDIVDDDGCVRCDKVSSIAACGLYEYYSTVKVAKFNYAKVKNV